MEIINKQEDNVVTVTYQIKDDGVVITYIEYLQGGKCIDFILRNEHGVDIDDAELSERVQRCINAHEEHPFFGEA